VIDEEDGVYPFLKINFKNLNFIFVIVFLICLYFFFFFCFCFFLLKKIFPYFLNDDGEWVDYGIRATSGQSSLSATEDIQFSLGKNSSHLPELFPRIGPLHQNDFSDRAENIDGLHHQPGDRGYHVIQHDAESDLQMEDGHHRVPE
jgi:hypothetical protein